jgi:hypothetical protein
LKARLSQAEKLLAYDFTLYKDDNGEMIFNYDEVINFFSDNYPGIIGDEPVAIVYVPMPQGFSRELRSNVACSGYPRRYYMLLFLLISFVFQLWELMIRHGTHRQQARFSTPMG